MEKTGDPTGGLMEKYTSKVPNLGCFCPILVKEKMGDPTSSVEIQQVGIGGKYASKVPSFGVF